MKKLAQVLAFIVAAVMLLSLFGCGQAKEQAEGTKAPATETASQEASASGTSQDKPPINVTWFGNVGGTTYTFTEGILHNPVFDEIYKRTGCTWDFTPCIGTTDYAQKLGVILAGGDIPDVIEAYDGQALLKIIKAGVVREDLDALVKENGPNILKYTKKR